MNFIKHIFVMVLSLSLVSEIFSATYVLNGVRSARGAFLGSCAALRYSGIRSFSQKARLSSISQSRTDYSQVFFSRPFYKLKIIFGVMAGAFGSYGLYRLQKHAYEKGCSFFVTKKVKKITLADLGKDYEIAKKDSTVEGKAKVSILAQQILDYFLDNYQETKKFLHDEGLDLNQLFENVSKKGQQDFCNQAVQRAWFWDFQRNTYFAMFTAPLSAGGLKQEYTIMLCKSAIALKSNPIAGFKEEAFQERVKVLKMYADGKKDHGFYFCFKYNGALGQKDSWCL